MALPTFMSAVLFPRMARVHAGISFSLKVFGIGGGSLTKLERKRSKRLPGRRIYAVMDVVERHFEKC